MIVHTQSGENASDMSDSIGKRAVRETRARRDNDTSSGTKARARVRQLSQLG